MGADFFIMQREAISCAKNR